MHSRDRDLLIIKVDGKIVLALESHSLLGADFGPGREDIGGNGTWTRGIARSGSKVGSLHIESDSILNLDVLGLELPAETSTVESGSENGGFVCVDVLRDLGVANGTLDSGLNHGGTGGATGEDNTGDVVLWARWSGVLPYA